MPRVVHGRFKFDEGGLVDDSPEDAKYAVVENMPGYLPESDPVYFDNVQDAEDYAREQEAELEEAGLSETYIVDVIELRKGGIVQKFGRVGQNLKMAEGGAVEGMLNAPASRIREHMREQHGVPNGESMHPDMLAMLHELDHEREGHASHEHAMQEGAALVEQEGPGVPAIIGEAGPEAVIPLDDPEAVDVMAEAIEEGGAGETDTADAAEAVAEAAEEVAEAAEEVAEASVEISENLSDVLEHLADFAEEVAEDNAEVAEEAIEDAEEIAEHSEHITAEVAEEAEAAPEAEASREEVRRDAAPRKRHWSQVTLGELFGSSKR